MFIFLGPFLLYFLKRPLILTWTAIPRLGGLPDSQFTFDFDISVSPVCLTVVNCGRSRVLLSCSRTSRHLLLFVRARYNNTLVHSQPRYSYIASPAHATSGTEAVITRSSPGRILLRVGESIPRDKFNLNHLTRREPSPGALVRKRHGEARRDLPARCSVGGGLKRYMHLRVNLGGVAGTDLRGAKKCGAVWGSIFDSSLSFLDFLITEHTLRPDRDSHQLPSDDVSLSSPHTLRGSILPQMAS